MTIKPETETADTTTARADGVELLRTVLGAQELGEVPNAMPAESAPAPQTGAADGGR